MTEVAQKRIAGTERQESQGRPLSGEGLRVEAIHDFIRSTVATDSDEAPDTARIGLARNRSRFARSAGGRDLHLDTAGPQALQGRAEQFPSPPASCRRIHNCKIVLPQGSGSVFTVGNDLRVKTYAR